MEHFKQLFQKRSLSSSQLGGGVVEILELPACKNCR